ncbi:MAG: MotA/TolQ/ExbB proton channel family protein [candidate division WOR-3 bacterium]
MPVPAQATGGFFGPFIHAGWFAQTVIVVLLLLSIVTWAVVIRKARQLRQASRQTRQFLNVFGFRTRLGDYERVAMELKSTPLASLLLAGVKEFNAVRAEFGNDADGLELMQQLMPNITEAMERASSRETDRLESSMTVLSVTTMVAPFLGLLGTVQGVLSTFLGLRGVQIPTLQTIAPGISDALVTTVMGLVVAIPAAFFYNYFVGRIRLLQSEMERFSSELTGIFRREMVISQRSDRSLR